MAANNIDLINDKILAQARAYEEGVIREHTELAEKTKAQYAEKAQVLREKLLAEAETKAEAIRSAVDNSAETVRRNELLSVKVSLIEKAFETAKAAILSMDREEYVDFFAAKLRECASGLKGGVLSMNEKDMRENCRAIIEKSGIPGIEPASRPSDYEGGFVLTSGDVHFNCTVEKLIETASLSLEGRIASILFAE